MAVHVLTSVDRLRNIDTANATLREKGIEGDGYKQKEQ